MVHGFDSISIAQFPAMVCSVSAEGSFNHTWSDFSRLLRVMISETRILSHFILVLLSSALMKQLACNVDIISLLRIFGLDI